jgi:hypothetical protein
VPFTLGNGKYVSKADSQGTFTCSQRERPEIRVALPVFLAADPLFKSRLFRLMEHALVVWFLSC